MDMDDGDAQRRPVLASDSQDVYMDESPSEIARVALGKRPQRTRSLEEATSTEQPRHRARVAGSTAGLPISLESTIQLRNSAQSTEILPGWHNFSAHKVVVNSNITNHYHNPTHAPTAPAPPEVTASEIIGWLNGLSYTDIFKAALQQQMPGTGNWFLKSKQFEDLADGSVPILWGMGMPGSGKTILSAISVERLQETLCQQPGVVVAYAFIRYSEKHSSGTILASLLSQAIRASGDVWHCLIPAYLRSKDDKRKDLTEKEIEEMLRLVCNNLKRLVIVVDGLDEASDSVKEDLLQVLPHLPNTSLLIMSRHLTHFLEMTPGAVKIDIQALTDDIELFVRERVRTSHRLTSLLRGKPSLVDDLCNRVKTQSAGMFLVARLQMEILQRGPNTLKQLRDILENLPKGLDAMYSATLDRISEASPEDASLARRILMWLVFKHKNNGLSSMALQHAVSIDCEQDRVDLDDLVPIERILATCSGLIEVPPLDPRRWFDEPDVRFTHYTTLEYMLRHLDYFGVASPHAELSISCLVYLKAHTSLRPDGTRRWVEGHELQLRATTSPLLTYAHHRWAYHAASAYKQLGTTHPYIRSFLNMVELFPFDLDGSPFGNGHTLVNGLHLAAAYGFVDVIQAGNIPFRWDPYKRLTPFHFAALRSQLTSLRALLTSGYPIDQLDAPHATGVTPLMCATIVGAVDVVREILCGTAGQTSISPEGHTTAEHLSTGVMKENCYRPEVDINAQDGNGRTALMYASPGSLWSDQVATVQLLLSHPAIDCKKQDVNGRTALMYATDLYILDATERLMSVRATTGSGNSQAGNGALTTPFLASSAARSVEIAKLILFHPSTDCNLGDNNGQTALMTASYVEFTKLLLKHPSINCNLRDRNGHTALDCIWGGRGRKRALDFLKLVSDININLLDKSTLNDASTYALRTYLFGQDNPSIIDITNAVHDIRRRHWTPSDICETAVRFLEEDAVGQVQFAVQKGSIAPILASLMQALMGRDWKETVGDDLAVVLFKAAQASCRSCIPVVLASLCGRSWLFHEECRCEHCCTFGSTRQWCFCIHCKARRGGAPARGRYEKDESDWSISDDSDYDFE